ncbi:MAG TPA: queuosine precursor transporter [Sphaerochaeta sp.]|nr:queuosine precursor transporter [Sphaerochaeta sp.]
MNELLWIGSLLFTFSLILLAFRLWGRLGLFIWVPISVIVANIQVTKNVQLLGIEATLGNIIYATSFLATDMLSEFYGKRESMRAVGIGFFSLLAMTAMMQLSLLYSPAASDQSQANLVAIFSLMPRIALASLAAFLVSNVHDVWAYDLLRRLQPSRGMLWLRNTLSTVVSQLFDTIIFVLIAFWGRYAPATLLQIVLSTYLLKALVALADTPCIYLARHWVESKQISDLPASGEYAHKER